MHGQGVQYAWAPSRPLLEPGPSIHSLVHELYPPYPPMYMPVLGPDAASLYSSVLHSSVPCSFSRGAEHDMQLRAACLLRDSALQAPSSASIPATV